MRKLKTSGSEFCLLSIKSFNGSGYADMEDATCFYASYIAYKKWKGKPEHVRLAEIYKEEAMVSINELLEYTVGAGRKPNDKCLKSFGVEYPRALDWLAEPGVRE